MGHGFVSTLLLLSIAITARPGSSQIQVLERASQPAIPLRWSDMFNSSFSNAVLRSSDRSVVWLSQSDAAIRTWPEAGAVAHIEPPPSPVFPSMALCEALGTDGEILVVHGNVQAAVLRRDGTWNPSIAQPPPLPLRDSNGWQLVGQRYGLVRDPSRARILLFRTAMYGLSVVYDSLEFDGSQWTAPVPIPGQNPPAGQRFFNTTRQTIQCVDTTNSRIVEWNGSGWNPSSLPAPFPSLVMSGATDDGHGHVLVVGLDGPPGQIYHKTLSWNGVQWSDLTTASEPGPHLNLASGVYLLRDPSHDEVLEISEVGVWAWNGTSWRPRNAAVTRPAPRNDAMLAEYVGTGAVLFGGRDSANQPNDETWVWDSTKWKQLAFAVRPPARSAAAMVRGPNGVAVLFGGLGATNAPSSDTWILDPANGWRSVSTSGASARLNHAMAFGLGAGPAQRVYLFGGTSGTTWFGDLRFLDTSTGQWVLLSNSGPSARDIHAMCVDERRKQLVLFGGRSASSATLGDTWEFDLNAQTWSQRSPAHSPSPRVNHAMVYDRTRDRIVLIGGYDPNTASYLDDVWEYDGDDWTRRTTCTLPMAPTENPAACFDGRTQRIVVFGGWTNGAPSDKTYELVEWNGPGTLHNDARLSLEVLGAPTLYPPATTMPLDLRFPNPTGLCALLAGYGPTPSPSFVGTPPLFCTIQTLHTPLQVLGGTASHPAHFTFALPVFLADGLLSLQAIAVSSTGCIDATDARNVLYRTLR